MTGGVPANLPRVVVSDAEYNALHQRIMDFSDAINQDKRAEPLVLSEHDIDAWIGRSPDMASRAYITLKDDRVQGQLSIPMPPTLARPRAVDATAWLPVRLRSANGACPSGIAVNRPSPSPSPGHHSPRPPERPPAKFMTREHQRTGLSEKHTLVSGSPDLSEAQA